MLNSPLCGLLTEISLIGWMSYLLDKKTTEPVRGGLTRAETSTFPKKGSATRARGLSLKL